MRLDAGERKAVMELAAGIKDFSQAWLAHWARPNRGTERKFKDSIGRLSVLADTLEKTWDRSGYPKEPSKPDPDEGKPQDIPWRETTPEEDSEQDGGG